MNEAANDSARVSGQDRKIPPALGTNQIAGFGGFCPLATLTKSNPICYTCSKSHQHSTVKVIHLRFPKQVFFFVFCKT